MATYTGDIRDKKALHSGEPGTTGREPFEDSLGPAHAVQNSAQLGHGTHSGAAGVGSELAGNTLGSTVGGGHHSHHAGHHERQEHHQQHAGTGAGLGAAGLTGGDHGHQHFAGCGHEGGMTASDGRENSGYASNNLNASADSALGHGVYKQSNRVNPDYPTEEGAGSRQHGIGGAGGVGAGVGSDDVTHRNHETHAMGTGAGVGGAAAAGAAGLAAHQSHSGRDHVRDSDNQIGAGHDQRIPDRTDASGPVTGGAAGTDRFDSTKPTSSAPHHDGADRGDHVDPDGVHTFGTSHYADGADHNKVADVTERGHDQGTGGAGGVLGTTDKEFVASDRLGKSGTSAYTDDQGRFQGNTDGPGGAALTGREGNTHANPANTGAHDEHSGEKPGLIQKIKNMI